MNVFNIKNPFEKGVEGFEVFDEYDEPLDLKKTYCGQMTLEQYEEETAEETNKAVLELVSYIEKNPEIYYSLLQKKKKDEIEENSGFFALVKSKLFGLFGKDANKSLVSEEECQRAVAKVTTDMTRVLDYSMETKGLRFSKRLAAKRQESVASKASLEQHTSQKNPVKTRKEKFVSEKTSNTQKSSVAKTEQCIGQKNSVKIRKERLVQEEDTTKAQSSSIPPAPPLPPIHIMKATPVKESSKRKFQDISNTPNKNENKMKITPDKPPRRNSPSFSTPSSHTPLPSCGSLDIQKELLSSNPMKRLKATGTERSPGGTPIAKKRDDILPREPLQRALVNCMMEKFRNVRSPTPGDSPLAGNTSGFTP